MGLIQEEHSSSVQTTKLFCTLELAPVGVLFLAKKLEFKEKNPEATELIDLIKVKPEEAVNMVREGKITHGPTYLLILKAQNYLK